MVKGLLSIIRLRQWIKNLFVLMPLFFGGAMANAPQLLSALAAMLAFCFAASAVYCFNDIIDAEADRRHPAKRNRPVASGQVSVPQAYAAMAALALLSAASLYAVDGGGRGMAAAVVGAYFAINMAYCAKIKQYAIVDVCVVAFGFVLRIFAGGYAAGINPSKWIVLMTFLLTLFLSFAKRRDDVLRMEATGEPPRKNTIRYNLTFINQAITITASVTLVCYIMYTVSAEVAGQFHTDKLYLTSGFVLVGLLRYIQLAVVDKRTGDPTKVILKDRFTQIVVGAWGLSFLFIIYG